MDIWNISLLDSPQAPLIQTVFNVNGDHVHPLPPGQALCIKRSGAWTLDQILAPSWHGFDAQDCSEHKVKTYYHMKYAIHGAT